MSLSTKTIRTPKPGLRNLMVLVDESSFCNAGGILPDEGVLYKDFPKGLIATDYFKLFQNFRYVAQGPDNANGGSLIFVKSMTDTERNTPYRSIKSKDNHYWHPLLRALQILESPFTPRSYPGTVEDNNGATVTSTPMIFSGPSFFVRQDYVPPATEGTLIIDDYYFGDVSYQVAQSPCPQPSSVAYDLPGCSGSFPECLHDEIIVRSMRTVTSVTTLGGVATPSAAGLGGQKFPATNFTGRSVYILNARQTFENGYNLVVRTVVPPPTPEESIR